MKEKKNNLRTNNKLFNEINPVITAEIIHGFFWVITTMISSRP